jgi:hypothetical protein
MTLTMILLSARGAMLTMGNVTSSMVQLQVQQSQAVTLVMITVTLGAKPVGKVLIVKIQKIQTAQEPIYPP